VQLQRTILDEKKWEQDSMNEGMVVEMVNDELGHRRVIVDKVLESCFAYYRILDDWMDGHTPDEMWDDYTPGDSLNGLEQVSVIVEEYHEIVEQEILIEEEFPDDSLTLNFQVGHYMNRPHIVIDQNQV
jgi:hypothetical protein